MIRPFVFVTVAWLMSAPSLPAHAQDVAASAAAASSPTAANPPVAASEPLDDRQPVVGKSIIRFPDHQFEIDGFVGILAADHAFWLVLPAGAPVLPVDPAAMRRQADGRTFYDVKRLGKITVVSKTVKAPSSVLPARFSEAIVPDETAVTAGSGVLHKGDVLLSVPYTYKSPVRLGEDFATHGLFGTTVLGVRGETGFDAGSFTGVGLHQRLLCFFDPKRPASYAAPDCFAEKPEMTGNFTLEQVSVDNNIPGRFAESRNMFANLKAPLIETDGVTIDHRFHLDLIAGSWTPTGYSFSWRSEGHTVEAGIFKANAEGAGYIHLGAVWLKLSRSPGGNDEIRVEQVAAPREFAVSPAVAGAPLVPTTTPATTTPATTIPATTIPATAPPTATPRAPATGAPQIIDGVVYTPIGAAAPTPATH